MYVDSDQHGRRWVSERDLISLQDPVRKAAEQLATDVETFAYDKASPHFRDITFLVVALRRYDRLKTGSGNYSQMITAIDQAVIDEAGIEPFNGPNKGGSKNRVDHGLRLNADARELLAAERKGADA